MSRKIRKVLVDELLAGCEMLEDLTSPNGLLKELTGALAVRALGAELRDHFGHDLGAAEGAGTGDSCNQTSPKTPVTEQGDVSIEVPRDRAGSFKPKLVRKHVRWFDGSNVEILSM